jgi:hypothetical protein
MDAILDLRDPERPKEPEWPAAFLVLLETSRMSIISARSTTNWAISRLNSSN